MSVISVPDFAIADIFKNNLVLIDEHTQPKPTIPKTEVSNTATAPAIETNNNQNTLHFLGNNNKKIIIVVNDASAVHLQDEALDFISKLLAACKLNMADVALLNTYTQEVLYSKLHQQLTPLHCILFGVSSTTLQLPFSIPNYQVQPYNNCSFVFSADVSLFLQNTPEAKLEKSKLWLALKKMFNI